MQKMAVIDDLSVSSACTSIRGLSKRARCEELCFRGLITNERGRSLKKRQVFRFLEMTR